MCDSLIPSFLMSEIGCLDCKIGSPGCVIYIIGGEIHILGCVIYITVCEICIHGCVIYIIGCEIDILGCVILYISLIEKYVSLVL